MPGCEDLITPLLKFDFNAYKEGKYFVKYAGCCYTFTQLPIGQDPPPFVYSKYNTVFHATEKKY